MLRVALLLAILMALHACRVAPKPEGQEAAAGAGYVVPLVDRNHLWPPFSGNADEAVAWMHRQWRRWSGTAAPLILEFAPSEERTRGSFPGGVRSLRSLVGELEILFPVYRWEVADSVVFIYPIRDAEMVRPISIPALQARHLCEVLTTVSQSLHPGRRGSGCFEGGLWNPGPLPTPDEANESFDLPGGTTTARQMLAQVYWRTSAKFGLTMFYFGGMRIAPAAWIITR